MQDSIELHTGWLYGEHNEWVISRVLFDFCDDSPNENLVDSYYDTVSLGDEGLFNLMESQSVNGTINTFSEFMDYFYSQRPNDAVAPILEKMNVIGSPTSPNNSSYITSGLPMFTWSNGGHGDYLNNRFNLFILASDGTLLLDKPVDDSNSYILSSTEWDNLLDNPTTTYEWYIEEEQYHFDYVLDLPIITGVYKTVSMSFNRPDAVSLYLNVPDYDYLQSLDNDWFKFTSPSSGYYDIYTTGTTDTYGELAWRIVSDFSSNDIVRSDQSSGAGSNFKMRVYIYSGLTIYVRVTPGQLTNSGGYYIVVSPSAC